jgi:urease accessory protein UreE
VESVLGSAADDVWTDRLRAAQVDVLRLDQAEAQKSRFRKTTSSETEVAVSHALGNQHWAAVVKGLPVYVPLTVARVVMESVLKTHAFEGLTWSFVPGSEVVSHLTPHEARRLFGACQ